MNEILVENADGTPCRGRRLFKEIIGFEFNKRRILHAWLQLLHYTLLILLRLSSVYPKLEHQNHETSVIIDVNTVLAETIVIIFFSKMIVDISPPNPSFISSLTSYGQSLAPNTAEFGAEDLSLGSRGGRPWSYACLGPSGCYCCSWLGGLRPDGRARDLVLRWVSVVLVEHEIILLVAAWEGHACWKGLGGNQVLAFVLWVYPCGAGLTYRGSASSDGDLDAFHVQLCSSFVVD